MTATWDPEVYARFRAERARPFHELLARVDGTPRRILDLGCGDGTLTQTLLQRFPDADVIGVDASADMLQKAETQSPRLTFIHADLRTFDPPWQADLIVSNAALHWVPDHHALLERIIGHLRPGGRLAVQVPANHDAASHRAVRTAAERHLGTRAEDLTPIHVLTPAEYLAQLHRLDCTPELWTTTYHHELPAPDGVLQWLEGTTLRPYLDRLDADAADRFLHDLGARLRAAYPPRAGRVVFPFTRLFFVATKRGDA